MMTKKITGSLEAFTFKHKFLKASTNSQTALAAEVHLAEGE
jgi:hypothetical protein